MSNPYYKPRPRIDTTVLRGLLSDAFEEAAAKHAATAPREVIVSAEAAISMSTRPSLRNKYHRRNCRHLTLPEDQRVVVDRAQAEKCGFTACQFCGALNLRSWCRTIGVEQSQVWQVLNRAHPRVTRAVFLRLLTAIGEQPHPSLLEEVS